MSDSSLVTVLMTNLNNGQYLIASIQSILDQSYQNLELVIIDDGSTDDSTNIINDFCKKDRRIITIFNSYNQGTSTALNQGLGVAQGEFITRQDGDDISLPNRIEIQVAFLLGRTNYGAVSSGAVIINQDGNEETNAFHLSDIDIGERLLDNMCICGPTLMVKRSVFEEIGFYFSPDLSYSEDYDLALRVSEKRKIANINEPLYFYRQHTSSVSVAKRHTQMHNKALALERSFGRRGLRTTDSERWLLVSRDYMRAAILAIAAQDFESAQNSLNQALRIYPSFFDHTELLKQIIRRYTPKNDIVTSTNFIQKVFESLLPPKRDLTIVRSRLIAELYAEQVFLQSAKNSEIAIKNLWITIKNDPGWLRNAGIRSLMVKSIIRKFGVHLN